MVKRSLIVIALLLMSSVLVFAVEGFDDQGNPNDPAVNDRANACYDGGSMAGKCDEKLEWDAGWYLIRFEQGLLSRDEVPAWAAWVLPEEIIVSNGKSPAPSPSLPKPPTFPTLAAGCYNYGSGSFSLQWGGGSGPTVTPRYKGPACTGTPFTNVPLALDISLFSGLGCTPGGTFFLDNGTSIHYCI